MEKEIHYARMHRITKETACRHLAERIGGLLKEGLPVGLDVMHYIESTHGPVCPETLSEYLQHPEDGGDETLIALVFTPDEAFQVRMEPMVSSGNFDRTSERRVIEILQRNPPIARLQTPNPDTQLDLALPPTMAEKFVSQLKITCRLPPDLTDMITEIVPEAWRDIVRVHFRNATVDWTRESRNFFRSFLKSFPPEGALFFPCIVWILELLAQKSSAPSDIYHLLIEKKRALFRSTQMAESFRRKLDRNNMETLMLAGNRSPYVDIPGIRRQMEIIDIIVTAVYGDAVPFAGMPVNEEVLADFSEGSMTDIIRFLSS